MGYRDDGQALKELEAEVIGVSGDSVAGMRIFKKVNNLNFTLLSDSDGAVARAFGVPLRQGGTVTKTVDGEEIVLSRGVTAQRWTFVIGKDSKIVHKDTAAKAASDCQNTLTALKGLETKE